MSNVVVVDANVALKWVLNETDSGTATALLKEWLRRDLTISAPVLLAYEATNILYRDVRADKITFDTARNGIHFIVTTVELEFSEDPALSIRAMELAQRFGLPASYDSQYLALAESKGCELWTADTRMWRVVREELPWVRWIGDYQLAD